jgi:hypothetical protein
MAWHCCRQCPPVRSMLNKAQQGFTRYHVQKCKQLVDAWCKLRLHMHLSPLCAASFRPHLDMHLAACSEADLKRESP